MDRYTPAAKLDGCSSIDRYELQRTLGEGTFGHVHQGLFKQTGTPVALKEIIVHKKSEGMPITALREIKIMKALRHANLLHVLDMAVKREYDEDRKPLLSKFYMVMAYMDHDLCGLLHNRTIMFKLPVIKLYMSQLLAGVAFLHDMQYMHRDMKSANILVSNDGNVKIADFGLARKFVEAPPDASSTPSATRRYTPMVVTRWFRPPELLLGDEYYTAAIDMWGVGCIFGEFFKRREILPGNTELDQINRIFDLVGTPTDATMPTFTQLPNARDLMPLAEKPGSLREVFHNVPDDALKLLQGLLTLDPMKRLTAKGALQHRFFTEGAPPARPEELPLYPSSRELDVREKRRDPSPLPPPPPKRQNRARAFNPKIMKRELHGIELIPPYRRRARPGEDRQAVMSNGLNY